MMELTFNGNIAVARRLAGEDLRFIGVQIGDGDRQDARQAAALNGLRMELPITSQEQVGSYVKLTVTFTNSSVQTSFLMKEALLIAQVGEEAERIAFAYEYTPESSAYRVVAAENDLLEMQLEYLVFVGTGEAAGEIHVDINGSLVNVTKAEFAEHTDDTDNPHNVTKDQVGLGDVPNVTTNGQTPTWDDGPGLDAIAADGIEITSGSKLTNILQKVAAGMRYLKNHLADAGRHINNGKLEVSRGGTGKTEWEAGGLIYAQTDGELGQVPAPEESGMVLTRSRSGYPYWRRTSYFGEYTGGGQPEGTMGPYDTSITVNGMPRMVVIHDTTAESFGFIMISPSLAAYGTSVVGGVHYRLICEATDSGPYTIVSWRSPDGDFQRPEWQLDVAERKYVYTIIY